MKGASTKPTFSDEDIVYEDADTFRPSVLGAGKREVMVETLRKVRDLNNEEMHRGGKRTIQVNGEYRDIFEPDNINRYSRAVWGLYNLFRQDIKNHNKEIVEEDREMKEAKKKLDEHETRIEELQKMMINNPTNTTLKMNFERLMSERDKYILDYYDAMFILCCQMFAAMRWFEEQSVTF